MLQRYYAMLPTEKMYYFGSFASSVDAFDGEPADLVWVFDHHRLETLIESAKTAMVSQQPMVQVNPSSKPEDLQRYYSMMDTEELKYIGDFEDALDAMHAPGIDLSASVWTFGHDSLRALIESAQSAMVAAQPTYEVAD